MSEVPTVLLDDGVVDLVRHHALRDGHRVALSTREAELLGYLAQHGGRTVSREALLRDVWGYRATRPTRAVDLCVRRLRKKIERDPSNPAHVITVAGEGYRFVPPAVPPPVPSPSLPVHPAIPAARTRFFGRGSERATLEAALQEARLVTLTGGAGYGKTRLALEIARTSSRRAVLVELASARDADDVLDRVAEALGVPLITPGGSAQAVAQLGAALEARGETLLLLDNFEQVVDAAATLVGAWLDRAPKLRLLVTSRVRLRLRGERLVELAPLDPRAAAALFEDRAATLGVATADPARVRAVVDRLEGIPLALELAAGRLRTFTLSQLARRLDDRFGVLVSPPGDRPPRHATLRAAIAWSWELLDAGDRGLLAALSVFHGGFDLEAMEEVLGADESWPEDGLASLVDKSLVSRHPRSDALRFHLLESVRAYAAERLAEREEADAVRERHARFYVEEGERVIAALATAERVRRLDTERANLFAAWGSLTDPVRRARAALVLDELLSRRGPGSQAEAVHRGALELVADVPAALGARLLLMVGRAARARWRFEDTQRLLERAEALLVQAPDAELARAEAMVLRGRLIDWNGQTAAARVLLRRAVDSYTALGRHHDAAWAEYRHARTGERHGLLLTSADVHVGSGGPRVRELLDAERALLRAGDDLGARLARGFLAREHAFRGRDAAAAHWLREAQQDWPGGDLLALSEFLIDVKASVLETLGDYDGALTAALEAYEVRRQLGRPQLEVGARSLAAQMLSLLGRHDEAEGHIRATRALASSMGVMKLADAMLRVIHAAVLLERGDPEAALAEALPARELLDTGGIRGACELWVALASWEAGRHDDAMGAFDAAVAVLDVAEEELLAATARAARAAFSDPEAARVFDAYLDPRQPLPERTHASGTRGDIDWVARSVRRALRAT